MSYFKNYLEFRNRCAEVGYELTPAEGKKLYKSYQAFRKEIKKAVKQVPSFYLDVCNKTTEQKLDEIELLNSAGCPTSLREYNELNKIIKCICEIEGYDNK